MRNQEFVGNPDYKSWKPKTDSNRRLHFEALDAFNMAERARKRLYTIARFWMGVAGLAIVACVILLVAWLS